MWCVQAASAELREQAAEGLGELVDVTSEETLKPFVVQITGQAIQLRLLSTCYLWCVHLPPPGGIACVTVPAHL